RGVGPEDLLRIELEPGLHPAALDEACGLLDQLLSARMPLAAALVHEERNRHSPGALPGDAPVGAILKHAGDALLAPRGCPRHRLDVAQRMRAQLARVHADEPLRGGAEDERCLVPPAMRIAVPVGL